MNVLEPAGQLLRGMVSVVTGGSSGIGRGVVERLAQHGSIVEFNGVDEEGVSRLQQDLRGQGFDVRGSVIDASDDRQAWEFMDEMDRRHGRIGSLVNSIGIQRYGTAETTSVETWNEVLNVNLKSIFLMVKYGTPLLRKNGGGAIVNVSSAQAHASQQNVVAYTATKGAIISMTRAMAVDYAPESIRVNSVSPGSVDTPMLRASALSVAPDDPDRIIAEWGRVQPFGRVGQPGEIADAILFLVSPLSSFITGVDLRVDGGLLAGLALRGAQAGGR